MEIKEKIRKIINKILRLENIERKHGLGLNLPRWTEFEFPFVKGVTINIDFIENKLILDHNNLYITTYSFNEKRKKNIWEEGSPNLIDLLNKITREVFQLENLRLIDTFNIPDEIISEISEIPKLKVKEVAKEKINLDILGDGESQTIEYKETFRWDVKNQNKNKKLKEEISKAVCAFLNAQGGKVFIGINDAGEVLGIEPDLKLYGPISRENCKDFLSQEIKQTLKSHIGTITIDLTDTIYHEIDNDEIIEIRVAPSPKPIFYFNEEFIVRNGNASNILEGKQLYDFLVDHFNYGPLDRFGFQNESEEIWEERKYEIRNPNLELINEYIELLKIPQIPDDLFLRRLNTIHKEYRKFNIFEDINEVAIKSVKKFIRNS